MGDFSILANRIKELRRSVNMTQREFAKEAGFTAATLSAYENGSKSPSLEIIMEIAKRFDVSIDWLCGLSEQKSNKINTFETYSDIINMLNQIQNIDLCPMKFDYVADPEQETAGLSICDKDFCNMVQDILKMNKILQEGTLDKNLYDTWFNGFLEKNNIPLRTWSNSTASSEE